MAPACAIGGGGDWTGRSWGSLTANSWANYVIRDEGIGGIGIDDIGIEMRGV